MNDAEFKLRVPTSELAAWKAKAGKHGLSAWIRERCNEAKIHEVIAAVVEAGNSRKIPAEVTVSTAPRRVHAKEKSKAVKAEPMTYCRHGLAYCPECEGMK